MLLRGGLAVRAPLEDRLLRHALVNAVVGEHLRLQHRACQLLLVRVKRILHAVEERKHRVAVLHKGGKAARLRILQDRVAVLVLLPKDLEQAVVRLHVAVHLVGQRCVEDVRHAGVVADVAPAVVDHVLRWRKIASVRVVPHGRVDK